MSAAFRSYWQRLLQSLRTRRPGPRLRNNRQLKLELLEDRCVPTTFTWTGQGGNSQWSNGGNWDQGGNVPQNGDSIVFAAPTPQQVSVNDSVGSIQDLTFHTSGYDVQLTFGGSMSINGQITADNPSGSNTVEANLTFPSSQNLPVTVTNAGATLELSGTLNSEATGLMKTGAGTLLLSGDSLYAGATMCNAGTVEAGVANRCIPTTSAVNLAAGAVFDLNGNDVTCGSLTGASGCSVTLGSATLTLGADNSSTTFSGGISGSGSLTKIGSGTLTLTGANTYGGQTMDMAGTLLVDGSIANSSIQVMGGATLGGAGSTNAITVMQGTLQPGDTAGGTLTANGNVTLMPQTTFSVVLGGIGPGRFSQLSGTGTINLGGAALQIATAGGFVPTIGEAFQIVDPPNVVGSLTLSATSPFLPIQNGSGVTLVSLNGPDAMKVVIRVYRDLLNRQPDTGGLSFWSGQLTQGVSQTQIVIGIISSTEYRSNVVESEFQQLLGRSADQSGLAFWVNFLADDGSGKPGTAQELEIRLTGSDEYFSKKGQNSFPTFIQAVYQDALNRNPDVSGAQFWLQQLTNGGAHQSVAAGILASVEADMDVVRSIYLKYLGRSVDDGGLASWTAQLETGTSAEVVTERIVGSDEYFQLATGKINR
jgi:autotransporter-associated beta strand protein